jgi:hypothetical protein
LARTIDEAASIRRALLLILLGLLIEVFCLWQVKPGTFVVFTVVAVPLVVIGIAIFVRLVFRVLRRTGGL